MTETDTTLFFSLIQVALGTRTALERTPTADEWRALYRQACRQTLAGVLFAAIERLPADERPPRRLLLEWFAKAERIRQTNVRLNREAVRICRRLEDEGFGVVLLKGQGVAAAYPVPELRTPGDIDLWVVRDGGRDYPTDNFRAVTAYARRLNAQAPVGFLHTTFALSDVTEVEAHFRPSFFFSPLRMRRLTGWSRAQLPAQLAHRTPLAPDGDSVCTPTAEFNAIYLLLHIFRHLFHEGIGLRQLMDYHYSLLCPSMTAEKRMEMRTTLRRLGLWRFARAVSYVLATVFGTPEPVLLAPPHRREGRFLLNEIMTAGNFGRYDTRTTGAAGKPRCRGYVLRMLGNMRLLTHYPGEAIWAPAFRTWHYAWRKWNGYLP